MGKNRLCSLSIALTRAPMKPNHADPIHGKQKTKNRDLSRVACPQPQPRARTMAKVRMVRTGAEGAMAARVGIVARTGVGVRWMLLLRRRVLGGGKLWRFWGVHCHVAIPCQRSERIVGGRHISRLRFPLLLNTGHPPLLPNHEIPLPGKQRLGLGPLDHQILNFQPLR